MLLLSPAARSRLLLLIVGSNIFEYPSTAVHSHASHIRLAILPNRSARQPECTRTPFLGSARQCYGTSGPGSVLAAPPATRQQRCRDCT